VFSVADEVSTAALMLPEILATLFATALILVLRALETLTSDVLSDADELVIAAFKVAEVLTIAAFRFAEYETPLRLIALI